MAKISRTYRFEEGEHPILTPLDAGAQTENKDRAVNELNKGSINETVSDRFFRLTNTGGCLHAQTAAAHASPHPHCLR